MMSVLKRTMGRFPHLAIASRIYNLTIVRRAPPITTKFVSAAMAVVTVGALRVLGARHGRILC
jgi:hypothetical protein